MEKIMDQNIVIVGEKNILKFSLIIHCLEVSKLEALKLKEIFQYYTNYYYIFQKTLELFSHVQHHMQFN